MKRTMAMTTLWIAAAAVVAGGATTALATTGGSPGAKVLTQSDVRTELAKQSKPANTVLRGGAGTVQDNGGEWAIKLKVGTVYLRCKGDRVTTFRVVGKPGYQASIDRLIWYLPVRTRSTPATSYKAISGVQAVFVKKSSESVEITGGFAGCVKGKPVQLTK